MASASGTLYIGMTNDLIRRVLEHKQGIFQGFSKKYHCHKLIYFEHYDEVIDAIEREKQLKRWNRGKKSWLIAKKNSGWRDLYQDALEEWGGAFPTG